MATTKKAVVPAKKSLLAKVADKFSVEPTVLQSTLKETVFKGATDSQTVALLIVADQYGLNPFTREIYAFPAKNGGITPIVGIDGWLRIINDNPSFDGMELEDDEDSCTCKIHRKDRNHPIVVTEYLDECKRNTDPWNTMPKRMLRHKAIIQCARIAFGFVGIYDEEEGKKIAEAAFSEIKEPIIMPEEITPPEKQSGPAPESPEGKKLDAELNAQAAAEAKQGELPLK